eukprot:Polyplicarium_translucidae@DN1850_c0_g1_i1.p1
MVRLGEGVGVAADQSQDVEFTGSYVLLDFIGMLYVYLVLGAWVAAVIGWYLMKASVERRTLAHDDAPPGRTRSMPVFDPRKRQWTRRVAGSRHSISAMIAEEADPLLPGRGDEEVVAMDDAGSALDVDSPREPESVQYGYTTHPVGSALGLSSLILTFLLVSLNYFIWWTDARIPYHLSEHLWDDRLMAFIMSFFPTSSFPVNTD